MYDGFWHFKSWKLCIYRGLWALCFVGWKWQKPKGLGLTCLFGKGWGIDVNGQSWQIPPIGPPISLCDASWSPWRYDVFGANQHLSKGWRPGWLPLDGNPAPVWSYHDKGESSRLQALLHILQLRRRTKDQDLFQVQKRGIHHGRSDSGHLHRRWKGGYKGFCAQASTASSIFAGMLSCNPSYLLLTHHWLKITHKDSHLTTLRITSDVDLPR